MNKLLAYRRLFWTLIFPLLKLTGIVYLASWLIIFGGFLPQEVCDTAAFTHSIPDSRASSSSEFPPEILSAPFQLQECLDNLVFQQQYALSSAQPELRKIAPVIKEVAVLIEAFNPSLLDWHRKLHFFVEDLQTRHIIFSAHLDACLAVPKRAPRPLGARALNPVPEALSVMHGYDGTSFLVPRRHADPPTTLQVHRQLQWQYARFRSASGKDLEALLSHPGRAHFDAFARALAPALQNVRTHTTAGKTSKKEEESTLELLHRDMETNPSHAKRTLDSLGRSRHNDPHSHHHLLPSLQQQRVTLPAITRATANAAAFILKVAPYLPRTQRELLELDARFRRLTAGDLAQGRGAVAVRRFGAQAEAVLVLVGKAGVGGVGWRRVREGAERGLGVWRGGEGIERLVGGGGGLGGGGGGGGVGVGVEGAGGKREL